MSRTQFEKALDESIAEAEKFLERAKELRERRKNEPMSGTHLSGAVRRSSLELGYLLGKLRCEKHYTRVE